MLPTPCRTESDLAPHRQHRRTHDTERSPHIAHRDRAEATLQPDPGSATRNPQGQPGRRPRWLSALRFTRHAGRGTERTGAQRRRRDRAQLGRRFPRGRFRGQVWDATERLHLYPLWLRAVEERPPTQRTPAALLRQNHPGRPRRSPGAAGTGAAAHAHCDPGRRATCRTGSVSSMSPAKSPSRCAERTPR